MQFSIVGTGNIAWFLGNRLSMAGHNCSYVYGRNEEKASALAKALIARPTNSFQMIGAEDDAVILAVPDYSISEVSRKLTYSKPVIIHSSGFTGLDAIMQPNKGVIWPIYSIRKGQLPTHRAIPLIIESSGGWSHTIVKNLANNCSDLIYETGLDQRKWLHLAAVIGNNFVNHLLHIDEKICEQRGLDFELIKPILMQTIDNLKNNRPSQLQTGPATRNDEATMAAQTELLQENPGWQNIYKSISDSIKETNRT